MLRPTTFIMIFGFMFSFFSTITLAQDCDAASLSSDLADFSAQMETSTSVSSVLDEVSEWLVDSQDACANAIQPTQMASESGASKEPVLAFSSTQDGNQPVLGPLAIPDGIYRVRLTTDGSFVADVKPIEGECYLLSVISRGLSSSNEDPFNILNVSVGKASSGSEVVLSGGCTALITITDTTEDWSLELFDIGDVSEVEIEYTSETEGLMTAFGPLVFIDGTYKISLVTDGIFKADLFTRAGSCKTQEPFWLFNVTSRQPNQEAQTLLTTVDCIGIILISEATEPWALTFEPIE